MVNTSISIIFGKFIPFIEYSCPDGYHKLSSSMDADVKYLGIDGQFNIQECKDKCHAEEKCDLFVYQHFDQQCDLLKLKRRSFVIEIGLTSDAIFCIKPSKNNQLIYLVIVNKLNC